METFLKAEEVLPSWCLTPQPWITFHLSNSNPAIQYATPRIFSTACHKALGVSFMMFPSANIIQFHIADVCCLPPNGVAYVVWPVKGCQWEFPDDFDVVIWYVSKWHIRRCYGCCLCKIPEKIPSITYAILHPCSNAIINILMLQLLQMTRILHATFAIVPS